MNNPHDIFDSIVITTVSTRRYFLSELDLTHLQNPKEPYDQQLTLHNLVSFKEENETPPNKINSGVVKKKAPNS
jgi:hypothetical protein